MEKARPRGWAFLLSFVSAEADRLGPWHQAGIKEDPLTFLVRDERAKS